MKRKATITAPLWAWAVLLALLVALAAGTAVTVAKVDALTETQRALIQEQARERVRASQGNEATETEVAVDISTADWRQVPLGPIEITHYCSCALCCGGYADGMTASGAVCAEGRTIACDFLPFGTLVNIGGHIYTVEDMIGDGSGNHIDIYVADHDRALRAGRYTTDCYVVVAGEDE